MPVGRGRRFGSDMHPAAERVAGRLVVSMTGRVQSGRMLTATRAARRDERGGAAEGIQDPHRPETQIVTMLPQDIIQNTRRAFSTCATSADGYGGARRAERPLHPPASCPGCVRVRPGDCGEPGNIFLTAPLFTRFDMSLKKRIPLGGRVTFDVEFAVNNVFDKINFVPVFNPGSGATIFQTNSHYTDISQSYDPGGRLGQIIVRLNW